MCKLISIRIEDFKNTSLLHHPYYTMTLVYYTLLPYLLRRELIFICIIEAASRMLFPCINLVCFVFVTERSTHVYIWHRECIPSMVPMHRLLLWSMYMEARIYCRCYHDCRVMWRSHWDCVHTRYEEEDIPLCAESANICIQYCSSCWVSRQFFLTKISLCCTHPGDTVHGCDFICPYAQKN